MNVITNPIGSNTAMAMVAVAAVSPTQWPSAATPGSSFVCGTCLSSFTARQGLRGLALNGSTTVDKRRRNAVVRCARPGPPVQNRHSGAFIPAQHRWMYEGIKSLGPDIWNKTYYPKAADHLNADKTWYIVDASNKRLGRLASAIAYYIRGKNNPMYTPSLDMGSYVVVVNAEKVGVTGKKRSQKLYRRHSGRPGGLKEETFDQLQKRIPERIVEHAVKGMLPKNRLGRALFRHLKVYKGEEHPHAAQGPVPLPLLDKRINLVTE